MVLPDGAFIMDARRLRSLSFQGQRAGRPAQNAERSVPVMIRCQTGDLRWRPYLRVIAERATHAVNVLDRFHIAAHMNKAIDKIRAEEAKSLRQQGENQC